MLTINTVSDLINSVPDPYTNPDTRELQQTATNEWMVIGIIFIVLFVFMTAVCIFLCVLRLKRVNAITEKKRQEMSRTMNSSSGGGAGGGRGGVNQDSNHNIWYGGNANA